MRKYFAFIVELIINFIEGNSLLRAYAEEEEEGKKEPEGEEDTPKGEDKSKDDTSSKPASNSTSTTVNFEDLISKARKEEKEKLYPQIETLKNKEKELIEKNNKHLLTIEEKDSEIKKLKEELEEVRNSKMETESETVKRLQKEIKELRDELENEKQNKVDKTELENSIREELKEEYEVKLYRMEKINSPEYRDSIIPELVMGTSKEEIDASLELAKQRYDEIVNSVIDKESVKLPSGNVNTSKFNTKEFTIEDIMSLDPRSEEYAEFRKKMGLK